METRNKAWRRFRRTVVIARRRGRFSKDNFLVQDPLIDGKLEKAKGYPCYSKSDDWVEKNWKQLYTRGCKLIRAKKLGMEYPRRTWRAILSDDD